jgi:hypothetical protein
MGPVGRNVAKSLALGLFAGAVTHLLTGQVFGYVLFPVIAFIGFLRSSRK